MGEPFALFGFLGLREVKGRVWEERFSSFGVRDLGESYQIP